MKIETSPESKNNVYVCCCNRIKVNLSHNKLSHKEYQKHCKNMSMIYKRVQIYLEIGSYCDSYTDSIYDGCNS